MEQVESDIVVERQGPVGLLTLNRPKALNALSLNMIRTVAKTLRQWEADQGVRAIVLTGAGDRAFCAGGDIKTVYQAGIASPNDTTLPQRYFADEYLLNRAMFHYSKPVVALMNGIVMGGGYGLAGQCRFRVACEKTVFAMPEVGIGFFPDVGSAWHLARMPDRIGFCLGITGMTASPADMRFTGVSTHDTTAERMGSLMHAIASALEAAPHSEAAKVIEAVLEQEAAPAPVGGPLESNRAMINRAFAADRVETVLEDLNRDGSEFARELAAIIESRSPTAMKITMLHLHKALQDKSFDDVLQRDYALVSQFLKGRDFYEGIRAAVIDRDRNPSWKPAALAEVGDETVRAFFDTQGPVLAESAA